MVSGTFEKSPMNDPYQILGINKNAYKKEIRERYEELMAQWNPSKQPTSELKAKAEEEIQKIEKAYSILSDPRQRALLQSNEENFLPEEDRKNTSLDTNQINKTEGFASQAAPKPIVHKPRTYHKPYKPGELAYPETETGEEGICHICGRRAPVKRVTFRKNIGYLFFSKRTKDEGNYCRNCAESTFLSYTAITAWVGWIGFIAVFYYPFVLLSNIFNYLKTIHLQRPTYPTSQTGNSKLGLFAWVIFVGFLIIRQPFSFTTIAPIATSTPKPKITIQPTKTKYLPPPTATQNSFSINGKKCIKWDKINNSHIGKELCVYGKVVVYKPNKGYWNTIEFSSNLNAFKIVDFNYFYWADENAGDCAIAYGLVRDNGNYLILTPKYDFDGGMQYTDTYKCY